MTSSDPSTTTRTYPFRFDLPHRLLAAPFGISPSRSSVQLTTDRFRARFGPWLVETPLDNVAGAEVTGPYRFLTTAGPAHLSFTDRGLTFATNGDRGVCVRFHEAVPGLDPARVLRHPGLTVTVLDVDALHRSLTGRR